jgi:hypothetical protein
MRLKQKMEKLKRPLIETAAEISKRLALHISTYKGLTEVQVMKKVLQIFKR